MIVKRECVCEKSNLYLRLLENERGWFCQNCKRLWELDGYEEQLYKYAYRRAIKEYEEKVNKYDRLCEIIKEMK